MTEARISNKRGLLAISPLVVFLLVYMLSSLVTGDFYKIPISASFLIASVYAFCISSGGSISQKVELFSKGAGDRNILLMIWIYILAGAFSQSAVTIGAVDTTVNIALKFVSPKLMLAGLFFTACFVSFSMGTSVGTAVTLLPMTHGIAEQSGYSLAMLAAIVIGGAFFGDNLSFISDTTIAATKTQNVEMSDKFKTNIRVAGPAALVVLIIYVLLGKTTDYSIHTAGTIQWIKILPYILIIVLSICKVNVALSLALGIVSCAVIGFATGSLSWTGWMVSMGDGISSMGELIIVTLLAGGLLELIRINGGLDYIIQVLKPMSKGEVGAQMSIALLVSIAGFCTANNTVAIITTGEIAKQITEKFSLNPKKTASILDTFSCIVQSIIPYGAQLLLVTSLVGLSALEVIPLLYYPMVLCLISVIALFRTK
ncbi:MAG: Na+/H+ antiporter NhaC family protein [Bacteroidales bacterium]|nr:Na+/H+ antiporter NhaC family protein [Bacteroidales bacterium]